jgi:rhamnosyltransferase
VKQIQETITQEDSMGKVSIIIRNRNEGEFIGFALQSCLDFFDKPEIIIVDNNSTDDSLEVVSWFNDRTSIKILPLDKYTPGRSINLGVQNATHDTVLVLSAHCQITEVNLELTKDLLKENVAIFGQQNPIYKGKKITKRYIWSHFSEKHATNMHSDIENRYFLHNAFCFYNREFLIQNPMPEQYAGKEDRYWAADVVNKGYTYLYTPVLKCNHYYTHNGATWKGLG